MSLLGGGGAEYEKDMDKDMQYGFGHAALI
jgi:hypothetical protein